MARMTGAFLLISVLILGATLAGAEAGRDMPPEHVYTTELHGVWGKGLGFLPFGKPGFGHPFKKPGFGKPGFKHPFGKPGFGHGYGELNAEAQAGLGAP